MKVQLKMNNDTIGPMAFRNDIYEKLFIYFDDKILIIWG